MEARGAPSPSWACQEVLGAHSVPTCPGPYHRYAEAESMQAMSLLQSALRRSRLEGPADATSEPFSVLRAGLWPEPCEALRGELGAKQSDREPWLLPTQPRGGPVRSLAGGTADIVEMNQ